MKNKHISFCNLSEQDFPLLLKWLETPHVKTWWDNEVVWTLDKITQKYSSYVNQYKIENGKKKSIFAFIILLDEQPIGYIQYYDVCDFLTIRLLISKKVLLLISILVKNQFWDKGLAARH